MHCKLWSSYPFLGLGLGLALISLGTQGAADVLVDSLLADKVCFGGCTLARDSILGNMRTIIAAAVKLVGSHARF